MIKVIDEERSRGIGFGWEQVWIDIVIQHLRWLLATTVRRLVLW
jgi:hypothetical protein